MIIETVKQLENGYLVNGSMSVPEAEGNRHYALVKEWLSVDGNVATPEFTPEEIATYDSQEYARNRASAYPPIGDQLDMIYHAGLGGDAFQAAISAVKQEYPK